MHSPWTSTGSLAAALARDIPMFSHGNTSHRPLLLRSHGLRHVLSDSLGWALTMALGAGLATHNRLLLSTLESPAPSIFLKFKLLHSSLSFNHHIFTYFDGSCYRLAMAIELEGAGLWVAWWSAGLLSSSPGAVLHGLDLIRRLSLFIQSRIPFHWMAPLSVGLPSQSSLETSL